MRPSTPSVTRNVPSGLGKLNPDSTVSVNVKRKIRQEHKFFGAKARSTLADSATTMTWPLQVPHSDFESVFVVPRTVDQHMDHREISRTMVVLSEAASLELEESKEGWYGK